MKSNFAPKKVLILSKITRFEFEKRTHKDANDAQLEQLVRSVCLLCLFFSPADSRTFQVAKLAYRDLQSVQNCKGKLFTQVITDS